MKKSKKIIPIIIIILIILCIAGFIVYKYIEKNNEENILAQEATNLSSLDISKDTIDMNIKTTGKYAIIESAMKNCLKDYQDAYKNFNNFTDNSNIEDFLNVKSYESDAPEFTNTKKSLSDFKTQLNEKIDNLITKSNKDSIMEYIKKENLGNYYNNLYEKLMFDEDTIKSLESEKNEIQNIKTVLNDMIDCMQNIFTYLSEHKNKWTIQNQMFYFEDDESLIEYNKLLTQLQEKIDSAENILSNKNTEEENSNSTNKQQ